MNQGTVTVVVDDEIRWVRHIGESSGGVSIPDRKSLLEVLSLLVDATEQVTAQLRALECNEPRN